MRTLTEGQKRQVLIEMIYENDNKFIGKLNGFARQNGQYANYLDNSVSTPMAFNFLKKRVKSVSAFCDINGRGKNWLNYMTDVELLHYLDYQNRMGMALRKAEGAPRAKRAEEFFNIIASNKVGFNEYYSTSADCPRLEKKLQVPDKEKLPKSVLRDAELRNSVLLEVMLKAHNAKNGTKDRAISQAVADKFMIKVKVPTLTEQVRGGLPTPTYDDKDMYREEDIIRKDMRPVAVVYGEPVYEIEDPRSETGYRYVTSTGEDLTEYYYAGEIDREYEDD